jgi:hypothetical protein
MIGARRSFSFAPCASALCALAILFLLTTPAAAQRKRFAAFGGYSSRADIVFTPVSSFPISIPNIERMNGWNGSFEAKLIPIIGVVADVSGHYGSYGANVGCEAILICVPVNGTVNSSLYSVMFGPQASVSLWRFTPFVHALFGVAHINHKADLLAVDGLSNSDTSFADAFGGGFDFRIVSIVSWRFQADLLQTRFFNLPPPISYIVNTPQNGFRGSTGVVLRF